MLIQGSETTIEPAPGIIVSVRIPTERTLRRMMGYQPSPTPEQTIELMERAISTCVFKVDGLRFRGVGISTAADLIEYAPLDLLIAVGSEILSIAGGTEEERSFLSGSSGSSRSPPSGSEGDVSKPAG
jgi:hypothetical protein